LTTEPTITAACRKNFGGGGGAGRFRLAAAAPVGG